MNRHNRRLLVPFMVYNTFSSNKNMFPNEKGFSLLELLIIAALCGIGLTFLIGIATGIGINTTIPSKKSCIEAGGQWSEGIQYGRTTQLCTYN